MENKKRKSFRNIRKNEHGRETCRRTNDNAGRRNNRKSTIAAQGTEGTSMMDDNSLPNKKYNIIYADPPWSYDNFQGKGKAYGDVSAHYKTMSLEEMKKLQIQKIADDNSAIFLWATYPNLKEALELIESWGFKYRTVAFTWIKTRSGEYYSGLGFYTNSNAEICLLGIRGKMKRNKKDVKQLIVSELREHSRKPDETRNRIVELFGNVPRIELFARQKYEGWDAWGNEIAKATTQTLLKQQTIDGD